MRFLVLSLLVATSFFGTQKLTDYKKNVYSQFGEDGIIEKIFEIIGTTSKLAIEFGASNGFSCSNSANLWTKDWKGVLIESDANLYTQCCSKVANYPCIVVHRKVGVTGKDSLESIVTALNIGSSVDLLSIDVDGDDYYIFQSINELRPRVVICEYNPSIPAHLDVYSDIGNHIGCSVAALQRIAREKGYSLIAITDSNCFFVLNEEFHKFNLYDTKLESIRIDTYIFYIITDYSGNYQAIGQKDCVDPWGWSGRFSPERCRGNIDSIPCTILKNQ